MIRTGNGCRALRLFCILLAMTGMNLFAQVRGPEPDSPAPPPPPDVVPPAPPLPGPTEQERAEEVIPVRGAGRDTTSIVSGQSKDDLITITLDDVPLVDVIRMFTRISGANIIASPTDLQGAVTVNLQDVAWRPALSSILDMHGLALVEKDLGTGVFSVVPRPKDAPPPMLTKSFKLKFATVKDVSPIIRSMLPESASISEFPSRNMIVVRSSSENLTQINGVINDIDTPTRQVSIETKFMELNDSASQQLGIRWDSLENFGARLSMGPFARNETRGRESQRTDALTRSDSRRREDSVTKYFDKNNLQFEQSDIEFTPLFPEATTPEDFLAEVTITPTRTIDDRIAMVQDHSKNISDTLTRTVSESRAAVLEMDSFAMVMSALKKTDGVSIISNPKLIVANGSTNAFFSVGEREPIIKTQVTRGTQESPGDKVTAELDTTINTEYIKEGYLETGIDLRVVPVIKTDELIEAEITPSLKRKVGAKTIEGNSWPVISVKEIRTRFTLRSGQTVAIGGLTDSGDEKRVTKVPLLGDIPLLGKYLFSHSQDVKKQIETIIFVTLAVAEPDGLYESFGIPDNAELVHKRIIQSRTHKAEVESNLDALEQAADAIQRENARKDHKRLLKRRE